MEKRFSQWAQIVRAQYMTIPIVLSFFGNAYDWHIGKFNWTTAFLSLVGLMLAHMIVNVINDYFDHKSGIDERTERSPFNGGSGSIQEAIITPKETLRVGLMLLSVAALIGLYFLITVSWMLLPLLLVSAFFFQSKSVSVSEQFIRIRDTSLFTSLMDNRCHRYLYCNKHVPIISQRKKQGNLDYLLSFYKKLVT